MKRKSIGLAAVVFILALTQSILLAQQNNVAPKPIGKLIDLGGYSLHMNASGKGKPTVVLISGAGDFSFDWSLVQPEISRFTSSVSYDRSGLAWSDLGPTPRTMKQEAFELRSLLQKAGIKGPYVLVGHSIGGLIARVYAAAYPKEVAGIVLVDSTTEDTTLSYQGKLVRIRDGAKNRTVPPVQTLASSPPKPPTESDLKQIAFNKQLFGEPTINPPFDKLPASMQTLRLWALSNPKPSAQTDDFWPEELQAMHESRAKVPTQLGNMPLVVLIGGKSGDVPQGVTAELWKQLYEEKVKKKRDLASLSKNSKVVIADRSGHHIQLDQPELVVSAIRQVVESVRNGSKLSQN
jgi:pimeloyl-ACP methyl ester carboxylesterase